MVIAADHVRDFHGSIIDHHGEIIGRAAVRFSNHEIVQLLVVEFEATADDIAKTGHASAQLEPDHVRVVFLKTRLNLFWRQPPATPVVDDRFVVGEGFPAEFLQLFRRAETVIRVARFDEFFDFGAVDD